MDNDKNIYMMFLRTFRKFSYKPLNPIEFIDKKALIVENSNIYLLGRGISTILAGIPILLGARIFNNHKSMGWFNLLFSSAGFVGFSYLTSMWFKVVPLVANKIYLLDDGKNIKVVTYGLLKKEIDIKISDIINPEENFHTKLKIQHFGSWLIETTKGETIYILSDSNSFHTDVLKEILKGQDIEISEKEKIDNFIDI